MISCTGPCTYIFSTFITQLVTQKNICINVDNVRDIMFCYQDLWLKLPAKQFVFFALLKLVGSIYMIFRKRNSLSMSVFWKN